MAGSASLAFFLLLTAGGAHACTCVWAVDQSAPWETAPLVFRGSVIRSELLPQHPEMGGRRRYAVTFRVREQWRGRLAGTIVLHELEPGTDCMGARYETGQEYLVYASKEKSQDRKEDDYFWYGWTDVIPRGTILFSTAACTPHGKTSDPSVMDALRGLGRGKTPRERRRPPTG